MDGAVSDYDIGNIVLKSFVDEWEEAANVGSSVLDEKILEELSGDDDSVGGEAFGDDEIPDEVGAAGEFDSVDDFRKLIMERGVSVSSWILSLSPPTSRCLYYFF